METTGRERGIEGRRNWREERKDRGTCELENGAKEQKTGRRDRGALELENGEKEQKEG